MKPYKQQKAYVACIPKTLKWLQGHVLTLKPCEWNLQPPIHESMNLCYVCIPVSTSVWLTSCGKGRVIRDEIICILISNWREEARLWTWSMIWKIVSEKHWLDISSRLFRMVWTLHLSRWSLWEAEYDSKECSGNVSSGQGSVYENWNILIKRTESKLICTFIRTSSLNRRNYMFLT